MGYLQKARPAARRPSSQAEQCLFQTQHEDPHAHRFDGVPNGIYEVDLRSAELAKRTRFGQRLFDVSVESSLLLPAHDITYEVGLFTADEHRFFVDVVDNHLDVRFVPLAKSLAPVLNGLRVAHRPDR